MPNRTTLHHYIANNPVEMVKLDFRFGLARKLAAAVLSVGAKGLVHKNVRSDSTLILQSEDRSKTEVFLTNWWLLGSHVDFTTVGRAPVNWKEEIFRHPRRYLANPKEAIDHNANIGHDVYSLGVCLIEIGMWEVLVKLDTYSSGSSAYHGSPISETFLAAAGHAQSSQPNEAIVQIFANPDSVKEALEKMAQEQLPSRMGQPFADLVKACLNGLERGFDRGGERVDFRTMTGEEQTLSFNELVLAPLTNALPGFYYHDGDST